MENCTGCGQSAPLRKGVCKPCRDHQYYLAHAEKIKARVRAYGKENKEKIAQRAKVYQQAHRIELNAAALARYHRDPSKQAARSKRWKTENHLKVNALGRRLYAANRERYIAYARGWQKQHPDNKREIDHRYRARKLAAFVEKVDPQAVYERDKGVCQWCKKRVRRDVMALDHIVPLSLGGPHETKNVQLVHRRCNNQRWVNGPAQTRLI